MLIPQFSLRWLLGVTTVCAVLLSMVALGIQGAVWASAVTVAVVALMVLAAVHAMLFAAVWLFAEIMARLARESAQSPFLVAPIPGGTPGKSQEPSGESPFVRGEQS